MRFDGVELGHAWLAVAAAAGTNKKDPILCRTMFVEEYDDEEYAGVLLYATDRYMLLKAWVPEVDGSPAPPLDIAPTRVVIASDADGRAKSLLGYVLALAHREGDDYTHGQVAVRMDFDQRLPAGHDPQASLEGMDPSYVVLTVPDVEKVYLEVVEAEPVDWRMLVAGHAAEYTDHLTLGAEIVERLAKARKHASGRIVFGFAGTDRAVLVEFEDSDPHVSGGVMPVSPSGYSHDDTGTTDGDDDADGCATCAEPGRVCFKHATGFLGSTLRPGESIEISGGGYSTTIHGPTDGTDGTDGTDEGLDGEESDS